MRALLDYGNRRFRLYLVRNAAIADEASVELGCGVKVECAAMFMPEEPAEDRIRANAVRCEKGGDVLTKGFGIMELRSVSGYGLMMRQQNILLPVILLENFDQPVPLCRYGIVRATRSERPAVIGGVKPDESPVCVFEAKERLRLPKAFRTRSK